MDQSFSVVKRKKKFFPNVSPRHTQSPFLSSSDRQLNYFNSARQFTQKINKKSKKVCATFRLEKRSCLRYNKDAERQTANLIWQTESLEQTTLTVEYGLNSSIPLLL